MDNFKLTPAPHIDCWPAVRLLHDRKGNARADFSVFDPTEGLVQSSHIYNAPKGDFRASYRLCLENPPFELIPRAPDDHTSRFLEFYYDTMPLTIFEEGLAQNPIGPTAGFTIIPTAPDTVRSRRPDIWQPALPQTPLFRSQSVQRNLRTPNTQNWNLNIQQETRPAVLCFQLGYVGNHSTHQLQLLDINQPLPGADNSTPAEQAPTTVKTPSFQPSAKSTRFHQRAGPITTRSKQCCGRIIGTALRPKSRSLGRTTWTQRPEVENFFGTSGYVPQDSTNFAGQLREFRIRSAPRSDYHVRLRSSFAEAGERIGICT